MKHLVSMVLLQKLSGFGRLCGVAEMLRSTPLLLSPGTVSGQIKCRAKADTGGSVVRVQRNSCPVLPDCFCVVAGIIKCGGKIKMRFRAGIIEYNGSF